MIFILLIGLIHTIASWFFVTRILRPGKLHDLPFEVCTVAVTTFYGLPIVLGLLTGYINTITVLLAALFVMVGALIAWHRSSTPILGFRTLLRKFREFHPAAQILTAVIALFLTFLLVLGLQLPVRGWDAPGYHIVNSVRWAQTGKFIIDSFGNPFTMPYFAAAETYPNVKGVLPFLVLRWTESTRGTAIAQWPFLCLLVCALYALYRRLNLSPALSLVAIIFCITSPEGILQSVEAYADLAFFAGLIAVSVAILRTWQDGSSKASVCIAAMAFAQFAGTKPTALPACAVIGAWYLFVCFMRPLRSGGIVQRFKTCVISFTAVVAVALVIAGVWPIHGLVHLENPVYPIEVAIGDKVLFEGPYPASMNADFVSHHTGRSGFDAWWATITDLWRSPSISSWSSGLGAAMFIVGLPATFLYLLTLPFLKRRRDHLLIILLFAVLIITCPAITLARFLLFTLGLAGLAIGVLCQTAHRVPRIAICLATLAICTYNVVITLPSILYRFRPAELVTYDLVSGYPRAARTDTYPEEYSARDYWLDFVAGSGKRIAITEVTGIWFFYNPQTKADMVRIPSIPNETFTEWLDRAVAEGATHVFIPRTSPHFHDAYNARNKISLVNAGLYARASRADFMDLPLHGGLFEVMPD